MSDDRKAARAAKLTLLLAVALTTIGTCGVGRGTGDLTNRQPPEPVSLGSGDGEVEQAAEESAAALTDLLWGAPQRRPLAAAHILVSVMLVAGGLILIMRRTSAVWWITQAVIANVLWTLGDSASQVAQLIIHRDALAGTLDEIAARVAASGDATGPQVGGIYTVWLYVLMFAGWGAARCAIYLLMLWRVRRPDVGEVLRIAKEERERS